ncbi:hypothetical protein [Mycoplasma zalophi]|uniref:Uncharacterized protein n=1 Tax=Mycoplasma zalophi TaxID=191287 RepID=A0ABS6DNV9_9MOLU|nr:hypothetical protein [Mycoplasma zalophi]MBU4691225.1 hypothetical protein [Mycoplasma zalophi]MBU4692000.1 hypothetical protein [Mycoplasma zalophi]
MQLEFKSIVNSNNNEFLTQYTTNYIEETEDEFIVLKFENDKNKLQTIKISKEVVFIQDDLQNFELQHKKYCLIHYLVDEKYIEFYSYLKEVLIDVNEIKISYDLVNNLSEKNILASVDINIKTS